MDSKYTNNTPRLCRDFFLAYLFFICCLSGTLQGQFWLIFNIGPKPGLSVSGAFITPALAIAVCLPGPWS